MSKKTFSTVMGAAIATSLASVANAGENPFLIKELANGYMQTAEAGKEQREGKQQKEMVCGEGKCGAQMMKTPEMNCGAMKAEAQKKEEAQKKAMEGKCAGMNMNPAPAQPNPTPPAQPPKAP